MTPPGSRRLARTKPEKHLYNNYSSVAEGVGFEPTVPARVQRFSRPPRSTTPAPLRARPEAHSRPSDGAGG